MTAMTSGVLETTSVSDLEHKKRDMSYPVFAPTMGYREGFGDERVDRFTRELASPVALLRQISTRRVNYEGSHYSDHRN